MGDELNDEKVTLLILDFEGGKVFVFEIQIHRKKSLRCNDFFA